MKLFILTLLLVAVVADFEARSLAEEKMKNIDYLSMGYNIYKGNPLPTVAGVDPGFGNDPIFLLEYSTNRNSSDGRYLIPDGTNLEREDACKLEFKSNTITGSQSYSNSLKQSVTVIQGSVPIEFGASVEYQQIQEETTSSNKIFMISSGECLVYRASIDPYSPPQLDPHFKDAVLQNLTEQYDAVSYFTFLDNYGTHSLTEIHMGARISIIDALTEEGWKSLESQGVDVEVSAGYSALLKVEGRDQTNETQEYNLQVINTNTSSIGSKPPADGSINTWAAASIEEPLPIAYTLNSISELFKAEAFGVSDPAIAQKLATIKSNMDKALSVEEYCANLKSRNLIKSCEAPPPDRPLPILIGSCRFCVQGCGGLYSVDQGTMSQDDDRTDWFFDFPKGCDGEYGQNDMDEGSGVKLCCMKESQNQKGSCKLCTSCGNEFPNPSGSLLMDDDRPEWVLAFGASCDGNARHPPNSESGISLCCNQPNLCSFCSSCGGDYANELGAMSAGGILSGLIRGGEDFFRGRGLDCEGDFRAANYSDGMKMCCSSPGASIE